MVALLKAEVMTLRGELTALKNRAGNESEAALRAENDQLKADAAKV